MMELALFTATSFFVGLSGALAPGPMLSVTISDSVEKGFIAGPLIISGHIISEIILVILLFAGLGWLIGSAPATFIIGLIGGLVLIVMGLQMVKSKPYLKVPEGNLKLKSKSHSVLEGILSSISNPYFFIWWATIGGAFLFQGVALAGLVGISGFLIGHWSSDLLWYSTVSFLSSRGSRKMKPRTHQNILQVCGLFLVIIGAYFILNAFKISF